MSKYIECKKILDFCNVVINRQGNEEEMNVVVESFKAFAEYVKALPPADVQPVVQWIPCSERLPEEAGKYLITEQNYGFKFDAVCKNVLVHSSYFSVNEKEFQDTVYMPNCSNITAWMPLPEPYKEGEQDEH